MIKKNNQQNQDQDPLVRVSGKSIEKRTTTKITHSRELHNGNTMEKEIKIMICNFK